jgi:hypothetical protein
MNSYKLSKYNIFIDKDKKKYLFNLLSSKIFSFMSHELFRYLKQCSTNEITFDSSKFDDKFIAELYNHYIILPDDEDEMNILYHDYNKDKFDDSYLSFGIYPTCLLRNPHFFEKKIDITKRSASKPVL